MQLFLYMIIFINLSVIIRKSVCLVLLKKNWKTGISSNIPFSIVNYKLSLSVRLLKSIEF